MEPSSTLVTLDPGNIALRLLLVFALILLNAFFVASEFSLVSVRRTRIDQLAAEGNKSARAVQRALRDISRYIAAVQVGITLVGLVLGSMGEQALSPLLNQLLSSFMPEELVGVARLTVAVGLAYAIMTLFAVIIGELLPKAVTLQKAESVALFFIRPMTLFVQMVSPFVWFLNLIGNALLRLMGIRGIEGKDQVHSPEELNILFDQSHEGGEISATEREILHRVVRFSDMTAREIMIPRVEMQGLKLEMPLGDLTALLRSQPHTRIPVMGESMDDILGVVHLKDLVRFEAEQTNLEHTNLEHTNLEQTDLEQATTDSQNATSSTREDADIQKKRIVDLTPLLREAARVPETISIDKMLLEFKRRRQQMAIVIDEYGGTSGLITMGDLLEQVFGDVHDEFDERTAEIEKLENGAIQLNGRVLISEINEKFHTGFSEEEADTMAGLVLNSLGRPAAVGDEVTINKVVLRVEQIERLRITQVLMTLPPENTSADEEE